MNHIDQVADFQGSSPRSIHSPGWMEKLTTRHRGRQASDEASGCVEPGGSSGEPQGAQECEIGPTLRASAGGSRSPERGAPAGPENASPISIHVHKSGNPDEIRTYDEKFLAKLDRYAKAVGSSSDLISYLENIEADPVGSLSWPTRLERLRACARYLEFRKFYTLPDQPTKLAKVVRCCQSHLCAFCAITRAAKTLKYWHPRIMGQLLPGVVPDLVTLTRSSTESIGDAFASMSKALVKLWKSGRDGARPGRAGSSLSHAIGAGFSFEVKRGEGTRGGGWHVHTHGIVLSPGGVCADHLREDWCELLGGAADPRAQDVRPLRSFVLFTCDDLAEAQLAESMGHDLCEVFKYPMKFSSLTPADRVEAFRCLSGRRLFRAMGALKGCEPDPAYLDEELQLDDLPHLRMVLRYAEGRYVMERQEFC